MPGPSDTVPIGPEPVLWVRDTISVLSKDLVRRNILPALVQDDPVQNTIHSALGDGKTVALLAKLGRHDLGTLRHSLGVSLVSALWALQINADLDFVRGLVLAAALHDVGKLALHRSLLQKTGQLAPAELALMRQHTNVGWGILLRLGDGFRDAAHVALQHHEHWFGDGYPQGVSGAEIGLMARVVAIADTYEALCSDRPYRPALSKQDAIAQITGEMAHRYDPTILSVFLKMVGHSPNSPSQHKDGVVGVTKS